MKRLSRAKASAEIRSDHALDHSQTTHAMAMSVYPRPDVDGAPNPSSIRHRPLKTKNVVASGLPSASKPFLDRAKRNRQRLFSSAQLASQLTSASPNETIPFPCLVVQLPAAYPDLSWGYGHIIFLLRMICSRTSRIRSLFNFSSAIHPSLIIMHVNPPTLHHAKYLSTLDGCFHLAASS
ncbi:Uncharacterized protein HZ326_25422 [Fusarium oxysporum f. sp. albedinis]|nr:Uncharacterized protein HZ326_25422 [Fusarium oxysporum f. sp. albedinis]